MFAFVRMSKSAVPRSNRSLKLCRPLRPRLRLSTKNCRWSWDTRNCEQRESVRYARGDVYDRLVFVGLSGVAISTSLSRKRAAASCGGSRSALRSRFQLPRGENFHSQLATYAAEPPIFDVAARRLNPVLQYLSGVRINSSATGRLFCNTRTSLVSTRSARTDCRRRRSRG